MRFHFLGACGEVGRSANLVESDKRMLLDYGVKLGEERIEYPMPFQGFLDAFILSHTHLDHCGHAPTIHKYTNAPFFATYPTRELTELLLRDSMKVARIRGDECAFSSYDVRKLMNSFIPLPYEKKFALSDKTSFKFHDAGHVAGAAITEIKSFGVKVVYTGDFKTGDTRMHSGASYVEKVDVLITESTYSKREHPSRERLESEMKKKIVETIDDGGHVLFPAFAVGRSQELLILTQDLAPGVPVFLDGMSRKATEITARYPSFVRNHKALRSAMKRTNWVKSNRDRKKVFDEPSIIISSSGMLEGGPSLGYLQSLNKKSRIMLTGFQVPGTNARTLVEEGKIDVGGADYTVNVPVDYYDLSAHAGHSGLVEFIKRANPEKVFCVHGDSTEEFAEELRGIGFDAAAPKMGDSFEMVKG